MVIGSVVLAVPSAPAGAATGRLVLDDEFNAGLSSSVWQVKNSSFGDGNHELECNTPQNATTSGGSLLITAQRQNVVCPQSNSPRRFTSAFVDTVRWLPMYGTFQVRAKIPHGQGLWPAFWLEHRNGTQAAEVDVMEAFQSQNPGEARTVVHSDGRVNLSRVDTPLEPEASAPRWHTYAVTIAPDPTGVRFTFSIDGHVVHDFVDTQHHWTRGVDPQATWRLSLNLAVGGDWVGDPDGTLGLLPNGTCAEVWNGRPPCATTGIVRARFPATYAIDWVRVTSR